MTRVFLLQTFLFFGSLSLKAQTDTLFEKDLRKVGDIVFSNLSPSIYGPALLNRSLTSNKTTLDQISGNYNQIHSLIAFTELYEDLALSYLDSTFLMNPPLMAEYIITKFTEYEQDSQYVINQLIQPFGFLLHDVSYIDTNYYDTSYFTMSNFHLQPLIGEDSLYKKALLKSAALFEFYSDPYAKIGYLKYEPELISTSPNISNLKLRLNVGDGFRDFNTSQPLFEYERTSDSMVGVLAFQFTKNGIPVFDTLSFYLTSSVSENINKSTDFWEKELEYSLGTGVDLEIMFRRGCGNSSDYLPRRPIIIAPPYRPSIQTVTSDTYYFQFNFANLLNNLSAMGYDIYFIRFLPGHPSLEEGAYVFSKFINAINVKKAQAFPNENWENIIMGYSMGGQIARYALQKMEKDHMDLNTPHHHSRLYIPFDSPHHGVNIPMSTQAVYYDYRNSNIFASTAWNSLVDDASKDMTYYHLASSDTEDMGTGEMRITPYPTAEAVSFQNDVKNSFLHPFSFPSDERRAYPSFTRNISISTGNIDMNYHSEYNFNPGKLLFEQDAYVVGLFNLQYKTRRLYGSEFGANKKIYKNKVWYMLLGLFPIQTHYVLNTTVNALEFDMASGGYKDEFYDKFGNLLDFDIVPIGSVSILRATANFWGQKHYSGHMMFLPTVSALAIRKNIWENNALLYDLKGNGLMYKLSSDVNSQNYSNTFGYPNLGRPNDHFNITPFEAIYCDPQTYEHIKMQHSVLSDNLNANYLGYLRNFILDEVEATTVALQNKTIGKNHIQTPGYKYRAWYKALYEIKIGYLVTPKTDPGDYIIESSGDITVHAGQSISILPGFHAQGGSDFHAFIFYDGCVRSD